MMNIDWTFVALCFVTMMVPGLGFYAIWLFRDIPPVNRDESTPAK